MVDFDTIDKYVAAVKRGGVAIQMKQIHNLDRFIEQVVYDFKEYADIDLTEEQKEYITGHAATVSGGESYEHLINKNGENEDLHVSFSDITQEYKAEKVPVYVETPNILVLYFIVISISSSSPPPWATAIASVKLYLTLKYLLLVVSFFLTIFVKVT